MKKIITLILLFSTILLVSCSEKESTNESITTFEQFEEHYQKDKLYGLEIPLNWYKVTIKTTSLSDEGILKVESIEGYCYYSDVKSDPSPKLYEYKRYTEIKEYKDGELLNCDNIEEIYKNNIYVRIKNNQVEFVEETRDYKMGLDRLDSFFSNALFARNIKFEEKNNKYYLSYTDLFFHNPKYLNERECVFDYDLNFNSFQRVLSIYDIYSYEGGAPLITEEYKVTITEEVEIELPNNYKDYLS